MRTLNKKLNLKGLIGFIIVFAILSLLIHLLSYYTKNVQLEINSWDNSGYHISEEEVNKWVHEADGYQIEIASKEQMIVEMNNREREIPVVHFFSSNAGTENGQENLSGQSIWLSKKLAKKVYRSEKVQGEKVIINDKVYIIIGLLPSSIETWMNTYANSDDVIVVKSTMDEIHTWDYWQMHIKGTADGIENMIQQLQYSGLNQVHREKAKLEVILTKLKLIKTFVFYFTLFLIFYNSLNAFTVIFMNFKRRLDE